MKSLLDLHLAMARGEALELTDAQFVRLWNESSSLTLVLGSASGSNRAYAAAALACAKAAAAVTGDQGFADDLAAIERGADAADLGARRVRLNTTSRDLEGDPVGYEVERTVRFALVAAAALLRPPSSARAETSCSTALHEAARSAARVLGAIQGGDVREPPSPEAEFEVASIVRQHLAPLPFARVVEQWRPSTP